VALAAVYLTIEEAGTSPDAYMMSFPAALPFDTPVFFQ
jgi:hypothetical protein